ncbi:MAG: hypothetical protein ABJB10_13705 [Mesorhizobium sp.]
MQPGPVVEGELLTFRHVGGRRYVRGLDIVLLMETRYPDFARLDLKFLRPIASHATISRTRRHGTAVAVSIVPREGDPFDLFIVNLETVDATPQSEPPLAPHLVLPRHGPKYRYLMFGRHAHAAILAVVFHRFQAGSGKRFVLRALHLERAPSGMAELVSLTAPTAERGLQTCTITRCGRRWCDIEMIEQQAVAPLA